MSMYIYIGTLKNIIKKLKYWTNESNWEKGATNFRAGHTLAFTIRATNKRETDHYSSTWSLLWHII